MYAIKWTQMLTKWHKASGCDRRKHTFDLWPLETKIFITPQNMKVLRVTNNTMISLDKYSQKFAAAQTLHLCVIVERGHSSAAVAASTFPPHLWIILFTNSQLFGYLVQLIDDLITQL